VTIQVDAIYQDGVFRPKQAVALPNGIEVRVAVEPRDSGIDPLAGVIGVGEGPAEGDVAQRHDDYLYGKR
jgi:predicted DNA-binding antitoxin AbrB/MazE fold protein